MIPRNLKHYGPYAHLVNDRGPKDSWGNEPATDRHASTSKHPDGGLYLPWGKYITPHELRRMRTDLVGAIETLAGLEGWSDSFLKELVAQATRGPLSELLPNLAHFTERLAAARAETEARAALTRRAGRQER